VFLHCDNLPIFGCLPYLCLHVVRAEELRRFSFNTQSSDALLGGELGYAGDDFQSGTNQILKTSRVQVAFWIAEVDILGCRLRIVLLLLRLLVARLLLLLRRSLNLRRLLIRQVHVFHLG